MEVSFKSYELYKSLIILIFKVMPRECYSVNYFYFLPMHFFLPSFKQNGKHLVIEFE